ncbi:toxin-antitoxin system TumE family protein [Halalkalirubrum salinum]|uniref:toxin-antitoxin system TumE family protein n=1 Tax=Halalkalirubrum salinum TaxID=2563889 RepID=UPI0010FB593E|nr:DUF6516 family protein [Halalkalirubrum salinum]
MGNPATDDLDGINRVQKYADGTLVRVFVMRTTRDGYPSGWAYKLHYGATRPTAETLNDGTIRRYDNSHEDTKGHELHVAPDPEPEIIDFPGMVPLWERFWSEIPKDQFDLE